MPASVARAVAEPKPCGAAPSASTPAPARRWQSTCLVPRKSPLGGCRRTRRCSRRSPPTAHREHLPVRVSIPSRGPRGAGFAGDRQVVVLRRDTWLRVILCDG
jgi:hypothetical protein